MKIVCDIILILLWVGIAIGDYRKGDTKADYALNPFDRKRYRVGFDIFIAVMFTAGMLSDLNVIG